MVEINNQRKAFLDMLAWSEELITDVRKPKSWLWRHCRREGNYLLITPITHSQTCHAKPKTQISRRRTLPASFPLVGCLPQAAWPERLLSENWDAVALQQIKERGALPMIDRGDIRQAIDRCSNIWASLPGAGYEFRFEHKADSLIAKFKEAGGTVREIDVWAESPRLSPLWLSPSSSVMGCIITVITPLPTKPDATKIWLKLANAANLLADASAWCCCARCKIHEGVSWC